MRKFFIAAAFAVALAVWLLSATLRKEAEPPAPALSAQAEVADAVESDDRVHVRARLIRASEQAAEVVARGSTQAKRIVEVRAEVNGQMVRPPVENGALVKRGAVLCQLDPAERRARVEEAEAVLRQARLEHQGLLALQTRGFQSATQVASAEARVAAAHANLSQRQLELGRTTITAPFDGIIEERHAELGSYLMPGQACATLVSPDPMLVTGQVSERVVADLRVGNIGRARLINGEWVEGAVTFIGTIAQEATRTYRVEITVPNPDYRLRAGITAEIHIPNRLHRAHLVSSALLALDDAGGLGIRILDENRRVQFVSVTILKDDPAGIWVTGLPELANIITVGQELVVPGQQVDVTVEPSAPTAAAAAPSAPETNQTVQGPPLTLDKSTSTTVAAGQRQTST